MDHASWLMDEDGFWLRPEASGWSFVGRSCRSWAFVGGWGRSRQGFTRVLGCVLAGSVGFGGHLMGCWEKEEV